MSPQSTLSKSPRLSLWQIRCFRIMWTQSLKTLSSGAIECVTSFIDNNTLIWKIQWNLCFVLEIWFQKSAQSVNWILSRKVLEKVLIRKTFTIIKVSIIWNLILNSTFQDFSRLTSLNWAIPASPSSPTVLKTASGCTNSWQSDISSLLKNDISIPAALPSQQFTLRFHATN